MAKHPVVDAELNGWYQCLIETYNDNLADLKLRYPDIFLTNKANGPTIRPPTPIREPKVKYALGPEWEDLDKKHRDALAAVLAKNGTNRDFLERIGEDCPCKQGLIKPWGRKREVDRRELMSNFLIKTIWMRKVACPCSFPDLPLDLDLFGLHPTKPKGPLCSKRKPESSSGVKRTASIAAIDDDSSNSNGSTDAFHQQVDETAPSIQLEKDDPSAPDQLSEMMRDCINLSIREARRSILLKKHEKKTLFQALKQMYFCNICKGTYVDGSSCLIPNHAKCKGEKASMYDHAIREQIHYTSIQQAVTDFLNFDLFPGTLCNAKARLRALNEFGSVLETKKTVGHTFDEPGAIVETRSVTPVG